MTVDSGYPKRLRARAPYDPKHFKACCGSADKTRCETRFHIGKKEEVATAAAENQTLEWLACVTLSCCNSHVV